MKVKDFLLTEHVGDIEVYNKTTKGTYIKVNSSDVKESEVVEYHWFTTKALHLYINEPQHYNKVSGTKTELKKSL